MAARGSGHHTTAHSTQHACNTLALTDPERPRHRTHSQTNDTAKAQETGVVRLMCPSSLCFVSVVRPRVPVCVQ